MFTGIVQGTAVIEEIRPLGSGKRLRLKTGSLLREANKGDSICVSGVCLTVADRGDDRLEFDVIPETLTRTTLGEKKPGDRLNLEPSLRAGDRLHGHFVQGHIDGRATVIAIRRDRGEHVVVFRAEPQIGPFIIPKGSICIDGVSLTLVDAAPPEFSVALIPTTLAQTTLAELRVGDRVNVESDILVRTIVVRLEQMPTGGLTFEKLQEAGFV